MAFTSKSHFFFIAILLYTTTLASNVAAQDKPPQAFHISIKKDAQTLQYYASLQIGTPATNVDAVVDLGGRFLSLACDKSKSSTRRAFSCGSAECKTVSNTTCGRKSTCALTTFDPFHKHSALAGVLTDDVVEVHSTDGTVVVSSLYPTHLSFSCVDSGNLKALAKGTSGILGLGRLPELQSSSLPSSLSSAYNVPPNFALCLPSSNEHGFGVLFIGGANTDLSQGISYTPLVYSAGSEYYVTVNSIKIDKRVVHFDDSLLEFNQKGVGGTKISTGNPYGVLHSAIYKDVVGDFVKRAEERNITQVAPVAPFGACFSAKGVRWTKGGPRVPTIDLALPGNMVVLTWRILGANSMVRVNKDVLCLGFVEGGNIKSGAAIVLGGHILEDNYLEFDLTRTMLGFTSSLLPQGKSCSHFRNL